MSDCCSSKKEEGKIQVELKELNKKIQYLYVDGCHAWLDGINELHHSLIEKGYLPKFEVICIRDDEMAKEYKFNGSPAVIIDGEDIDPMSKYVKNYSSASCRPYHYKGKSYEFAPKGMIKDRL